MNRTLCIASAHSSCAGVLFDQDDNVSYNYDIFYPNTDYSIRVGTIYAMFNLSPLSSSSVFSSVPYLQDSMEFTFQREYIVRWKIQMTDNFEFSEDKHMAIIKTKNLIVIEKRKEETIETTVIGGLRDEELEEWIRLLKEETSREDKLRAVKTLLRKKVT